MKIFRKSYIAVEKTGLLVVFFIELFLLLGMLLCFYKGADLLIDLVGLEFGPPPYTHNFSMRIIEALDSFLLSISFFILCRSLQGNYGPKIFLKHKTSSGEIYDDGESILNEMVPVLLSSVCIALIVVVFNGIELIVYSKDLFYRFLGISAFILAISCYRYLSIAGSKKSEKQGKSANQ